MTVQTAKTWHTDAGDFGPGHFAECISKHAGLQCQDTLTVGHFIQHFDALFSLNHRQGFKVKLVHLLRNTSILLSAGTENARQQLAEASSLLPVSGSAFTSFRLTANTVHYLRHCVCVCVKEKVLRDDHDDAGREQKVRWLR